MFLNKLEEIFEDISKAISDSFILVTEKYQITNLKLKFMDNIHYRQRYNKDLAVEVFDLRMSVVNNNGLAKIGNSDLVVMTDKLKKYINENEGYSVKLKKKFLGVMLFEIGHYLYFREFEERGASYEEIEKMMERYEADLAVFNHFWKTEDPSTEERLKRYYEIDFNQKAAEKVGLPASYFMQYDKNIKIPLR